ncbi:MAG: patatin-like phospholipase family protein [Rubrivivax sp.]|nr:patatin-like phospholipase family protein [Rubrivivax sp.]
MGASGGSGGGLKAAWGVADPASPAPGAAGSGEQADDFRKRFEASMSALNESLVTLRTDAQATLHQALDAQRGQLIGRFQQVLGAIDPADVARAQAEIDEVLKATDGLRAQATEAAQKAAAEFAQWQQRSGAFDDAVARVTEMNDWGHEKAAPFLAVADAIRARVDARKVGEALTALDRFLQPLESAYADFDAQKQAQAAYDELAGPVAADLQALAAHEAAGIAQGAAPLLAQLEALRRQAEKQDYTAALAALQSLREAADRAKAAAAQVQDDAQGLLGSMIGSVKDAVGQAATAVGEAAIGVADTVADLGEAGGEIGEIVGDSPAGSALGRNVGGAAGAVAGTLLGGPVGTMLGAAAGTAAGQYIGDKAGGLLGAMAGDAVGGKVADAARWVSGKIGAAIGQPPDEPPEGLLAGQPPSGEPITAAPLPPLKPVAGAGDEPLQVGQAEDGSVTLMAPPPKIENITFSGGGGKGAALPGAVRALENAHVLDGVKTVSGASVGSMTASLVAAGITADEFTEIANNPAIADQIKQGKGDLRIAFEGGLTGEGLQNLVSDELTRSVGKRIVEYEQAQAAIGMPPDAKVLEIAHTLADGKRGVTFRDLRVLSTVMPRIKEVAISGTAMCEVDSSGEPIAGTEQSKLMMFNADTQPDLEVALAVRASAALPPVFKPVDITLADGKTIRFQDGGVLNNAPTPESVGTDRQLDPMPEGGGLTFVFEEDGNTAQDVLEGEAAPTRNRIFDWLTGAENSAAEYGKNRALADQPQDVVMLPLKFTMTGEDGEDVDKNFATLTGGTVNFNMTEPEKLELQRRAEKATQERLEGRKGQQAHRFASMEQMLMSVPLADLAAMAADGFEGAAEALAFRKQVVAKVVALKPLVEGCPDGAAAAADAKVQAALAGLDELAGASAERRGVVAREMNRVPAFDGLIQAAGGAGSSPTMQVCAVVNDGVQARAHAKDVLRDVVYPKMVRTPSDGVDGELLAMVDDRLRAAKSPADVDAALRLAIDHFSKRSDPLGLKGHAEFAEELERRLMDP